MGVGGRTATLVGFTVVAGGLTGWLARRGLRAATESVALVGYGLLTLDVLGADNAGWFGDLGTAGLLAVLGTVLVAAAAAGTLALRRTTGTGLVGAELVLGLGVALGVVALDLGEWLPQSASLVLGTVLALVAVLATRQARLRVAEVATAVVAGCAWLALTADALAQVADHSGTWRELWLGGHVLTLLAAAALVGGLALLRALPTPVRVGGAAVAELLLAVGVLAPAADLSPTGLTLVALGVLVATSAATWLLPRPWGLADLPTQALAALGVAGVGAWLAGASVERLVAAAEPVWAGRAGDLLPRVTPADPLSLPAPWLLPLVLLGLVGAAWSLAEADPAVDRVLAPLADLRAAAALLALGLVVTAALYPVPVWSVVAALLVAAAGFVGWWLARPGAAPLALAAGFAVAGLAVSLHADVLTALAVSVGLLLTTTVQLRARDGVVAAVAGSLSGAALAGTVAVWGAVADVEPVWLALTGLLVLAVTVLAAPYAPDRWWRASAVEARTGTESGAAAAGAVLALLGLALAPVGEQASWAAVYLTTGGVALTVMSLLRRDRRVVGWAGGLLLAAASWVRLWDVGVHAPEAYTLPSAAALVVVGLVHLRRNPGAATMTALAPGVSLALVPSLLWVLADPTGPRALLLGLGCLALVLAGVALRWTAPLALGATVGALLVLRLAAPYVGDAVPRWVLIGAAGVLLVTVGATWERRLAEARQLVGYVRNLR